MRCLIVDDEPAAREILRRYISDADELELVGECKDALEARKVLRETGIDLLFLDINMPRLSGIELLKSLQNPPKVVLTTAYSDHALEGYELDVVDYLLKPFSFDRFLRAIEKADRNASNSNTGEEHIIIKADGKLYRIGYDEILYAESKGDYITVHTETKKLTYHQTLKNFEQLLPEQLFSRIHKSYLVSLSKIEYLEGNMLSVGPVKLPIGSTYKDNFMTKFGS